ncbi:MAG TPA: CdaR family protein [Anaerolineae bacterium]|nr:CdaR family protein [Anaerolineae bacterium]
MLRWLAQNIGNILLSLILAVVVWVVAVNEANPYRQDVLRGIPLIILNQPRGTIVYDLSTTAVDVTLSAPESVWAAFNTRIISATLDLSAAQPGDDLHNVEVNILSDSIARVTRVVRVDPPAIRLKLEPVNTVQTPVEVNLVGEPPVGYRISATVTQPMTVTARGPASLLSQVAAAVGEFSIQNARGSISETLALRPVDANGQLLPDIVRLEPNQAQLTVSIEQLAGFRDLAVKIELTGTLASGYRLVEVNATPPSVTVFGSPQALEALPGFVETEPVDLNGAQSDIERDVQLDLPAGVALSGQQSVRVTVRIEPIVSSLTIPSRPIAIGLRPRLAATVSPETVQVILVGALPVLDSIDLERDVRVIVDLTGLGIGTHQVAPRVEVPPGVVAQSILPPTVQVVIENAPRGTVTPRPTLRP